MMSNSPTYRRGDIVLVQFPLSDLKRVKLRPALIVQADGLNTGFSEVIIAAITSKTHHQGPLCRLLIPLKSQLARGTNLLQDSLIMGDQLATIDIALISQKIGRMPDMEPINAILRYALAL